MEATIKKLNGETVAVSVEPSDSVETALRKISELHGISNLSLAFLEKEEAATAAAEPEAAPSKAAEDEVEEEEDDPLAMVEESEPAPAQPEGESDDWETAGKFKETANEAKASGDWAAAVDAYTSALMAQASALTHANRADCLLKLKRPVAAIADCDRALKINPDSAKALKIKGKALRFLSKWEEALASLTQAMSIDFDPDLQEMQTFVAGKVKYVKARQTQARLKEAAELRAKVKAQREEQRRQAAERASATARSSGGGAGAGAGAAGGFPGMGGGGFPGMGGGMPPGMADIFR
jgi:suppressor of tumorigenicity protein 13